MPGEKWPEPNLSDKTRYGVDEALESQADQILAEADTQATSVENAQEIGNAAWNALSKEEKQIDLANGFNRIEAKANELLAEIAALKAQYESKQVAEQPTSTRDEAYLAQAQQEPQNHQYADMTGLLHNTREEANEANQAFAG